MEEGVDTRFNDGAVDRSGRLWADSMGNETSPGVVPPGLGNLYVMDCSVSNEVHKRAASLDLGNGIDWSVDNQTMFYTDSIPKKIYAADYDASTGQIKNQRVAVDFSKYEIGLPDGCTIDANNKLWVACYFGACVCCFDVSTGQLVEKIDLNTKGITSVAFGGPHMNQLFVTTANRDYENGGAIFRIDGLSTRGLPTNYANEVK